MPRNPWRNAQGDTIWIVTWTHPDSGHVYRQRFDSPTAARRVAVKLHSQGVDDARVSSAPRDKRGD